MSVQLLRRYVQPAHPGVLLQLVQHWAYLGGEEGRWWPWIGHNDVSLSQRPAPCTPPLKVSHDGEHSHLTPRIIAVINIAPLPSHPITTHPPTHSLTRRWLSETNCAHSANGVHIIRHTGQPNPNTTRITPCLITPLTVTLNHITTLVTPILAIAMPSPVSRLALAYPLSACLPDCVRTHHLSGPSAGHGHPHCPHGVLEAALGVAELRVRGQGATQISTSHGIHA